MRLFNSERKQARLVSTGDLLVLLILLGLLYAGLRLAFFAPEIIEGPDISLSPGVLPWYTLLSVTRMLAAYGLSLAFALLYGRLAAYNRSAEKVLLPLLDVLQSIPILSFLPVVLLSLSALFPERAAAELSSVVLIFTSQAWNLAFAWYQSLTTIPNEMREAASIFRLNTWFRFKTMELPFAAISLVWNSMMSWAGGWFFLMAAEIFTVGKRDFRLPGLGAYLHEAASQQNVPAILWGVGALVLTVILLDQLIWRPLMAWSERFKVDMVANDHPATSWFLDLLRKARLTGWFSARVLAPLSNRFDRGSIRLAGSGRGPDRQQRQPRWVGWLGRVILAGGLAYAIFRVALMLAGMPGSEWGQVALGIGATFLRVMVTLVIALLWTVPVGVAIGTNPRLAAMLQPVVQVVASVPATAIFPVFVLLLINLPGGLSLAAVVLMLMGTQWYMLFNVIAGASSIPQDLQYTARLIHLSPRQRWTTLILPALFPYLVTGMITASGGAWNASIVSEYFSFGAQTYQTTGIGAMIARATASGDYPLLLASTASLIVTVIVINRFFWRRMYRLAEDHYRME